MNNGRTSGQPGIYEIRVKGSLDPKWSAWFDDFAIDDSAGGVCRLTGPAADQAALHGLLAKIRDLGLPLLSVQQLQGNESAPNHPVGQFDSAQVDGARRGRRR